MNYLTGLPNSRPDYVVEISLVTESILDNSKHNYMKRSKNSKKIESMNLIALKFEQLKLAETSDH